jgi:molybdate transport system substrate-binding protein
MRACGRTLALALLASVLAFAACGGDDDSASSATTSSTSSTAAAKVEGSINVFAASSLTQAFTALGKRFEQTHPGTKIVDNFNFSASSDLVEQITQGAPADVFASADTPNMTKITETGANKGTPVVFSHNRLEIAVEPGNPLGIKTLADLAKSGVKVVLCAETVPCGRFADEALQNAGVNVTAVSREANVKDTLGKVGEADAAIVYVTDVKSASQVAGVPIPDDQNVVATLPIVALKDSGNPELAAAWVKYVTSPEAQKILVQQYGFLAP